VNGEHFLGPVRVSFNVVGPMHFSAVGVTLCSLMADPLDLESSVSRMTVSRAEQVAGGAP
jgi:hypothetical protein